MSAAYVGDLNGDGYGGDYIVGGVGYGVEIIFIAGVVYVFTYTYREIRRFVKRYSYKRGFNGE